jgi:steroid 5-alpha reductase family enzyme
LFLSIRFRKGNEMENSNNRSLVSVVIAVLVAAGVAWAGSQGGVRVNGFPLFALGVALAFVIQWLAFIPAYLNRTEKFYDLTGSITYISVVVLALALSPSVDARAWMLAGMVVVWAVRLGTFLYRRIHAAGEDRRFREIKQSFSRFLLAWTLQGLWVTFSLAAALAVMTSEFKKELGLFALTGFLVWLFGFGIEVTADWQKSQFKANPENEGKFIQTGLWSWSRHPNYFGEIVLWIGVAIVSLPILQGWQWLMLISPIFITLLLTKISGVPMLEARANEKWGGQEDYETYKKGTSQLIPMPPKK